ncbi:hypothetical protein Tco_1144418 [Tanacetum coccineum]
MGDENPIRTLGYYSKPSHEGYRNTIELQVGTMWTAKLRNDILIQTIDQSSGGKLRDQNAKESWALLEDLALYDNESWNDPRNFAKPVKVIALPQDVPSTFDRRLIELKNQVQRLMEAHLAPTQPTQVNKITTSCDIYSGPHDTQYCMEDPEQAFLNTHPRVPMKREYKKEEENPKNIHVDPPTPPDLSVIFITEKVLKFNSFFESLGLVSPSSNIELICTKEEDGEVMFIEIIPKDDNSRREEPKAEGQEEEYFDIFPIRSELVYNKYLMCGLIPSLFLRNPIIMKGCPSNLKIPCNIGHVHVEKAYINLNSPLNIMTRMMYNWIMRRKLDPRENANGGVSNFTGRIKGMHVFIGNFTYIVDFMIIEDISSIIDPRLSQVVLGKLFVEISNMTHDPPEGVVRFTNRNNEVSYKMPYKIEQYDSLSNLEKEHTKSVYLRNEEDKRRGVEYVMRKIVGFYKECIELGPEYLTGIDDEGEVT